MRKADNVDTDEGMHGRADYELFLKNAKAIRKKNITVTELCERLNAQRTTIYRIERAEVDPKLSTLMQYLNGFGYHLEVVQNQEKAIDMDFMMDVNGTNVLIDQIDLNKAKTDRNFRIKAVRILLDLIENDIEDI